MNTKYILLLLIFIGFTACEDDDSTTTIIDETVALETGSADFSNYVALGASFTAGYTDNGLFIAAQENSFPNILAQQFANAGGGSFTQPLMNDNIGGLLLGGTPIASPRLFFDGAGPAVLPGIPTTEVSNVLSGPFNNVGVPGAKSFHLLANGYGNVAGVALGLANPYFARMASNPNASMLEDALAQAPTFFTLSEIGGNDVLAYATSGGSGEDQTGNFNPASYGGNDITDPNVFANAFDGITSALTAGGAKGAVTTIPSITSLPHFTTVPYNPVPLDAATAGALNAGYAAYNGALAATQGPNIPQNPLFGALSAEEAAKRTINFSAGTGNALVVIDEDLTDLSAFGLPSYRQATADDLFVLSLSSLIPQGYGTQIPLEDKWVLTPEEQLLIQTATDAYNVTIVAVAASKGLAVVNLNSLLIQASTTGVVFDDFIMNTDLVLGGLISLDGIHLTARGYAYMANKFLEAIDATYGSNFIAAGAVAKAADYPTNYSPLLQ